MDRDSARSMSNGVRGRPLALGVAMGDIFLATDCNFGCELDSQRIRKVSLLFKMDRCTDFSDHGNSFVASGRNISKRKQSSLQTRKIAWFFGGSSSYFR